MKKQIAFLFLVVLITLVIILSFLIISNIMQPKEDYKIESEIYEAFETSEWVPVTVSVFSEETIDPIISTLSEDEFELKEKLSAGFTGNITKEGLEKLELNEDVLKVSEGDEFEEGQTEIKEGSVISVPIVKDPAPEWVLDKGKEYIVSYVEEEYYNNHLSVSRAWIRSRGENVNPQYVVSYSYNFTIKGDSNQTSYGFTLWLDYKGGLVYDRGVKYAGPTKPYMFNMSREEILDIAKEEGLPESTIETKIGTGGETYNITKLTTARIEFGPNFGIDENYIWYVFAEKFEAGKPTVVYIDVDSGEVLGTYIERFDENQSALC